MLCCNIRATTNNHEANAEHDNHPRLLPPDVASVLRRDDWDNGRPAR